MDAEGGLWKKSNVGVVEYFKKHWGEVDGIVQEHGWGVWNLVAGEMGNGAVGLI